MFDALLSRTSNSYSHLRFAHQTHNAHVYARVRALRWATPGTIFSRARSSQSLCPPVASAMIQFHLPRWAPQALAAQAWQRYASSWRAGRPRPLGALSPPCQATRQPLRGQLTWSHCRRRQRDWGRVGISLWGERGTPEPQAAEKNCSWQKNQGFMVRVPEPRFGIDL
jgi:hypothetical protein